MQLFHCLFVGLLLGSTRIERQFIIIDIFQHIFFIIAQELLCTISREYGRLLAFKGYGGGTLFHER